MKDCDGNELQVGDRVAVQHTRYKNLKVETVVGFTPKKVQVSAMTSYWNERRLTDANAPAFIERPRVVDPERLAKVFVQKGD
jgi:hypothetical protein